MKTDDIIFTEFTTKGFIYSYGIEVVFRDKNSGRSQFMALNFEEMTEDFCDLAFEALNMKGIAYCRGVRKI